jgi:aminoglycoside phosphotransferase (APT) family kinase protein
VAEITCISESDIGRISSIVFGSSSELNSVVEIRQSQGENPRIIGCNWNLSYIVSLAGHDQKYVFRFNRQRYDRDDAALLTEQEHNALIASRTPIPVPRIHHVDVSRTVVETGFIVMDFMPGDSWRFLLHPQNKSTSPAEKQQIASRFGQATAQLHCITRSCTREPGAGVVHGLDALERVVSGADCLVTPERIEACRRIACSDPALIMHEESYCVGDGEMHLLCDEQGWQVSFLCDLEYQGYGDPCYDMAPLLCHPEPIWSLSEPLTGLTSGPLAEAYFGGYEQVKPVDRERLAAIAIYAHLGTMCGVAREAYRADDGAGIEAREPPIYSKLLREIERRGATLGPG